LHPGPWHAKILKIALLDYGIKKEVKNMSAFNKDDDDEFAGLPEEEEDVDGDGTTYCYSIIHSY
jgi:hypothetical protein